MKRIELSHGGGGAETQQLIETLFFRYFDNEALLKAEDAAVLQMNGKVAFSTDSFTVSPIFFQGGDIGKLAVAGTVNDLAMMGAKPLYLSCALMIEEGLPYDFLERIIQSMADELQKNDAKIVCGDTKVVPKGAVDQIFINTSGLGRIDDGIACQPSVSGLKNGDMLIVSGDIGRHGAVVLADRESLQLQTQLNSDCASLWPVVEALFEKGIEIHAMRDATRGGLAAVLNEWVLVNKDLGLEIEETAIPICEPVQGLCEMMGFEAYDFANEGTFILALPQEQVEAALRVLQRFEQCRQATLIGRVTQEYPGLVVLQTPWGSQRVLEVPKGELLPRIC